MNNKTLKLAIIGLMSALAYISFTFLQIKIPTPGGTTSFHLGNTFCILAALFTRWNSWWLSWSYWHGNW